MGKEGDLEFSLTNDARMKIFPAFRLDCMKSSRYPRGEIISPTIRVLFKATHILPRTVERWLGWKDDRRHEKKYLSTDDLNEHLTSI